MTNSRITTTSNLSSLLGQINRVALGFDPIFHDIENRYTNVSTNNYPPYNISKVDEGVIVVEVAVAGFKRSEIEVEKHNSKLTISGRKEDLDEDVVGPAYTHKGISTRSFNLTWTLSDHVKIAGAKLEDGILSVTIEEDIPEEAKPKTIEIL